MLSQDGPVRIRPGRREDLQALFALDQQCFRPGIAYSRPELQYFLFHPRSFSVVAEGKSGLDGFAIAEIVMEHGRRLGHIVTIDVSPAQRRQGVGRLLMETVLDFCREAGAERVRLEVAVDNDGAIEFYKRLGFSETGRIRGYYMGKLDALVLASPIHAADADLKV